MTTVGPPRAALPLFGTAAGAGANERASRAIPARYINGNLDMAHYNDETRGALNIETATKEEFNNAMLNPLSASVLEKTSRADLAAMVEAPIPEPAGYSASEKQV